MVDAIVTPRGPYSLRLTARGAADATRRFRDGLLVAALEREGRVERAAATQRPDGRVHLRADSEHSLERLRFCLALDADHSEFLRRFARDPLLGRTVGLLPGLRRLRVPPVAHALLRALCGQLFDADHSEFLRRFARDPLLGRTVGLLPGLRRLRVPTVAHALLRALCGQLVEARQARAIERRIVCRATRALDGLHAAPTGADLARFSPAELRRLGLHARRGATLVRLCRSLDLERLREQPVAVVRERLVRERGLGPWSVGVIGLEGLGRTELGLVGDLGLVKLLAALRGRRAEAWETEELLAPYGEWAGLASVYLLAGWAQGLVPVPRVERRAA